MSGDEVRDIRRRKGWTQAELAEELGTDAVTVSRWERGVAHPRPGAVKRLSHLLVELGPRGVVPFVEDPTTRIRKLDAMRSQQISLKRKMRRIG